MESFGWYASHTIGLIGMLMFMPSLIFIFLNEARSGCHRVGSSIEFKLLVVGAFLMIVAGAINGIDTSPHF